MRPGSALVEVLHPSWPFTVRGLAARQRTLCCACRRACHHICL